MLMQTTAETTTNKNLAACKDREHRQQSKSPKTLIRKQKSVHTCYYWRHTQYCFIYLWKFTYVPFVSKMTNFIGTYSKYSQWQQVFWLCFQYDV